MPKFRRRKSSKHKPSSSDSCESSCDKPKKSRRRRSCKKKASTSSSCTSFSEMRKPYRHKPRPGKRSCWAQDHYQEWTRICNRECSKGRKKKESTDECSMSYSDKKKKKSKCRIKHWKAQSKQLLHLDSSRLRTSYHKLVLFSVHKKFYRSYLCFETKG